MNLFSGEITEMIVVKIVASILTRRTITAEIGKFVAGTLAPLAGCPLVAPIRTDKMAVRTGAAHWTTV
jgi:hypothetical protein